MPDKTINRIQQKVKNLTGNIYYILPLFLPSIGNTILLKEFMRYR